MTVKLTTSLKKSLVKSLPSFANENDAAFDIASLLHGQKQEITSLIRLFEKNLEILEHQKIRCAEIIGILEEGGGLTVRARNFMTTPQDAEKYKDKIKETENLFRTVLVKLDKAIEASDLNGINLTNGDVLKTCFDPKDENALITQGIQLTAQNLGIRPPDFSTVLGVQNSRIDVMNAIDMAVTLRNIITSDHTTLLISRDFSQEAIDTSSRAESALKSTTAHNEPTALKNLADSNPVSDSPLAEPTQQETLHSFASSPNMEDI